MRQPTENAPWRIASAGARTAPTAITHPNASPEASITNERGSRNIIDRRLPADDVKASAFTGV